MSINKFCCCVFLPLMFSFIDIFINSPLISTLDLTKSHCIFVGPKNALKFSMRQNFTFIILFLIKIPEIELLK